MTKDLQNMSRAETMISLLNISNRKEVMENLNETIQSYKDDNIKADKQLDYLFKQLGFDNLDQQMKTEIKNDLLMRIKSDAGYCLKENYIWNTNTKLAPLRETTATGSSISGPDSNRFTSINKRTKSSDGLFRNKPKKKPQDKDEIDIDKKLEALKTLFNNRNKQKITLTDIKKILQSESIEFRSNVRQKMRAINALILEDEETEDELLNLYFTEGYILNESSGGSSSSLSWSNWQSITHQVVIARDGLVKSSNTFLCRIGDMMDKEKYDYLTSKGVRIIEN